MDMEGISRLLRGLPPMQEKVLRLYFGLGSQPRADRLEIRWPDGQVQDLTNVEGDRLQVIHEEAAK